MIHLLHLRQPWSLQRTLVAALTAVVALVLLAVGVVAVVTVRSSVTTLVDAQLTGSMASFSLSIDKYRDKDAPPGSRNDPNDIKPLTEFNGQAPGTAIALITNGVITDSAVFSDSESMPLSARAIARIETMIWTGTERQNIDLAGIGEMRMQRHLYDDDLVLVAGVSMAAANAAVVQETIVLCVLALCAISATILCTAVVVRLALRPLSRLVATAQEVTDLPLGSGEVALTTRVGESDTDPRTEIGKVGEALNLLLNHVDDALTVRVAADRRMKQFVTDASHELRTPLAAIQGYAELTRQDNDQLPEIAEYSLARIESEAKRMSALVADLLLLARLDEGQDLHTTSVDLPNLVITAVNDALASSPSHRWLVRVPETAVVVNGDSERLHQLVANVLSNARIHTPAGSEVVTTLTTTTDGYGVATAEITIADNGPGIAPALRDTLFQRFVRGDKARSRASDSTGLGLAIVSSIVDAHHGDIRVESSATGTEFRIRIPMIDQPTNLPTPPTQAQSRHGHSPTCSDAAPARTRNTTGPSAQALPAPLSLNVPIRATLTESRTDTRGRAGPVSDTRTATPGRSPGFGRHDHDQ